MQEKPQEILNIQEQYLTEKQNIDETGVDVAKIIDVVALVLTKEGLVLLAQRPSSDRLANLWEFPGGKIEPGETPEIALEREIKEELGLRIKTVSHFITVEHHDPPVLIRLHAYFGTLLGGVLTPKFHAQVSWVPVTNLLEFALAPADIPIAANLIKRFS